MKGASRYNYARSILGAELFEKVQHARVLMVGAGGIGCELLKNLATAGFGSIHIIDLDTIDLSNLNRQFLFQKQHVKRSKALVAQETAQKFNPHVNITATHGNIKEPQFDVAWFQSFDLVLNALDNMDARRHVNKMCMAANVPLVESGTAGYAGQVQPIRKDVTQCYDCSGKPVPKGFAVCTIRSTPSTPIHCIVWAKSYLFPQLFGASEETSGEDLDKAAAEGEDVTELNELRKEQEAIKEIRETLGQPGAQKRVFDKIYKRDIERLLAMEDMWKHRKPPVPLSFDDLESSTPSTSTATKSINGIKDQRELSLHDSFQLFKDSLDRLVARVTAAQDPESALMDWDKDDDDALDFATATANLRAHIFGIPSKTRFDVKREVQLEQGFIFAPQTAESSHICCAHLLFFLLEMAGNIIPAIATTNAIVAGLIVLQALKVLKKQWSDLRLVYVSRQMDTAVSSTEPPKPNPHCAVCRTPYVNLSIDTSKVTIDQFVQEIARDKVGYPGDLAVRDGSRILYDPDEEENGSKTLAQMGITPTTLLTVDDEEGNLTSTVFVLTPSAPDASNLWNVLGNVPELVEKPPPPKDEEQGKDDLSASAAPTPASAGTKRKADEADLEDPAGQVKEAKKYKQEGNALVIDDDSDEEPAPSSKGTAGLTAPANQNWESHVIDLDSD